MCGIVGQFGARTSKEDARALLLRQLELLAHRGPDDSGTHVEDRVALGHARLSIIDLAQGHQPLSLPQHGLAITFNGEIYNYLELREELRGKGYEFRTNSDTEVLLCGYREWGEGVLSRLDGMFAFAIYDRAKQRLFCARDPFGQKPFFYWQQGEAFHFCSETRGFEPIPGFAKAVDSSSLEEFLRFESLYAERSMLRGVKKLRPGHFLTVDSRGIRIERYFRAVPREGATSFVEAVERADALLQESVRLCFRADVPVGVLLSGGLDSSLVLALLHRVLPQAQVAAFHIRVTSDSSYDESGYASAVARHCGSEFRQIDFSLEEMANCASAVLASIDEPQADPGIVPKYAVCRAIRDWGKVALTGDGADELFYGYLVFRAQKIARWYRHVPSFLHRGILRPVLAALPAGDRYMAFDFLAKRFALGFPSEEALRNARWTNSFSALEVGRILLAGASASPGRSGEDFLRDLHRESEESGYLGRLAHLYQNTYLPDYVLCNSDRASMLNSVELRTPFLAPRLASVVNSLPDRVKMRGFRLKHLLKRVAERHLPERLIYRKKMGFTIPAAQLLRTSLRGEVEDLFSESFLKRQGLFRYEEIRPILDSHFSGEANHYKKIWTLFSLQKWMLKNFPA